MRHRSASALSLSLLLALAAAAPAPAQPAQVLDLHQVMADPDWIGPPVERMWWSWDGRTAYFMAKRAGSNVRDTFAQPVAGGAASVVDGTARASIDGADPVFDAGRTRMAFLRNGDVFVRDLRSGALTQLTRTEAGEAQLQWSRDGALVWRSGQDWWRWTAAAGGGQAANVRAEDAPGKPAPAAALPGPQLRYTQPLRVERERRDEQRAQAEAWRRADPSRAPAPAYLGKDVEIQGSALSPDGRWLFVATQPKGADAGQGGRMPKYVTESGYEEFEDVRTRVGRNDPAPQSCWLGSVADGSVRPLETGVLPGIDADPLAALRRAAGKEPLKGPRPVRIEGWDGDVSAGARWSDDGRGLALMLHSVDNKDRWLATVDLASATLRPVHRLTDEAWINWGFNEFGWLPDGRTLWFLSEESGWSQLYTSSGGRARALTSGRWEASQPVPTADGRGFLFLCNRARPGDYEVCHVGADGGEVRELTSLDGVEDFVASPDGRQLLVRHSTSYMPPQLSVVDAGGGDARQLTDTRTAEFKAFDWLQPETVQVPSKHGAGTIWGKFYGPRELEPGRRYPIVLFVHGAGYLQNVSERYPNYFREQMFHNLLVQRGYLVLDLDFRASEGY